MPNQIRIRLKTPPYLQKGDTIGIAAPARKISKEELQPALDCLQQWGLKIRLGKNLFGSCDQFSGTDAERAADMQDLLGDPQVKAILCARGGYGTLRIIDHLDFSEFLKNPKWIVGYSDVTVLHSHLHGLGIETLHATMPIKFKADQESVESLRKALFGETLAYSWESNRAGRYGTASGLLVGGNLSLLTALNGSSSDLDMRGKILFLEDLDEYLYHIDRMMLNLKRSGKLKDLAGMLVGGMTAMKDNAVPFGKEVEEIIRDAVKEYSYPLAFDFPAGHADRNLALFLGREIKLAVGRNNTLSY
jgi:muramoyltetrapeptide carboxypeptidase